MRRIRYSLVLMPLIAGCGGQAATSAPSEEPIPTELSQTISGLFLLRNGERVDRDLVNMEVESCRGTGGYDDIESGLGVVVRDDGGSIIGTGELISDHEQLALNDLDVCLYRFEVADLPDAPFYTVEVGNRGELTYSRDELERADWVVEGNLGE